MAGNLLRRKKTEIAPQLPRQNARSRSKPYQAQACYVPTGGSNWQTLNFTDWLRNDLLRLLMLRTELLRCSRRVSGSDTAQLGSPGGDNDWVMSWLRP
jgi:hypothetical protein